MKTLHNKTLLGTLVLAAMLSVPASAAQRAEQTPYGALSQQQVRPARSTIELVFVLDTTGSMGGMLEGAKTKIWGIVNDVMQRRGNAGTLVKVGLVAYRDRGDAYLTKITPLNSNLDEVYSQLMTLRAEGGGDGPEDVRSALADALRASGWSQAAQGTSQIMFLVGDAPPHDDYHGLPSTTATARLAQRRGIIVNTIQCGNMGETAPAWRSIAQFGGGDYFAIAQDGGVDVVATPYDQELARLGEQMGGTYMAYGSAAVRDRKQSMQVAMESKMAAAPAPAIAERALNKAINASAYDESDIVQRAEAKAIDLPKIAEAELPDSLRRLEPAKRQAALDQAVAERKALREKIVALSKQRENYLAEQRRKHSGAKGGFDTAVSDALARQVK